MPQEVNACPLCQSTQHTLFDQRKLGRGGGENKPITLSNYLCAACGLVFMSPRMSDEELTAFYEREYRILYQGSQGPNKKDILTQELRAKHLVEFISKLIDCPQRESIKKCLDIGCSTGLLLKHFQESFHCSPTGIEPGQAYRDYGRESGLVVYASLEEMRNTINIPASLSHPFNLVSMIHVLEHIPDPVDYLKRLRIEFLAEDGWLLLEVPNLYAHDSFEIAHTISFSPHSLEQTLIKAGFYPVHIKAHGEPRSEIIPLYLTILARPASNGQKWSRVPERAVRQKRYYGLLKRRFLTRLLPKKAWKTITA